MVTDESGFSTAFSGIALFSLVAAQGHGGALADLGPGLRTLARDLPGRAPVGCQVRLQPGSADVSLRNGMAEPDHVRDADIMVATLAAVLLDVHGRREPARTALWRVTQEPDGVIGDLGLIRGHRTASDVLMECRSDERPAVQVVLSLLRPFSVGVRWGGTATAWGSRWSWGADRAGAAARATATGPHTLAVGKARVRVDS